MCPLMYVPNSSTASFWWRRWAAHQKNPVLVLNLVAHPDIEVQVKQNAC